MDWMHTLIWIFRGSAAGMVLFLVLVVGIYALVPLESPRTQDGTPVRTTTQQAAG